jgi:hypothetical protein
MPTVAKNRITREVAPKSLFADATPVIDSTVSFNQGDLLYLDESAHLLKPLTGEGAGATFCGVAPVTVISGKLGSPYAGLTKVDAASGTPRIPGPVFGVVAKLISKTGDAWAPGCAVYGTNNLDAQHVSSSGTKQIGVYQGVTIGSAAAGQEVEVLLLSREPGDVTHS